MPETGALIVILLLGSIIEAVKQVLYLPYEVNYQQEAMCVSWDESALQSNEVEKRFHIPILAQQREKQDYSEGLGWS